MSPLKPYPHMKDSGVPWLGRIPAHWKVNPHRALFHEVNERDHPDEPLLSVTIRRGVIPQDVLLADSSKKDSSNLDKSAYKLVEPGDIVYNKMRAWQGAIGVSRYRGLVSPAYIVVRPRQEQVPRYYHYLFRTPRFIKEAERWSYGITSDMWSLRYEDFKQIYGLLPPPDEQRAIARFLDHHDRLTRRYVRAQRRLIALLEEQKQALIQRAVTRGLDPDVKLKPSGIEWLGETPEHWTVVALRYKYDVNLGKMLDAKQITGQHLLPYLRNADVQWDNINVDRLPQMDISEEEYERYTLRPGDLLVCEGGEVGRCALWAGELGLCGYQKALHRLRPHDETQDLPRFLYYLFYTVAHIGVFQADGSENTIAHLTSEKLKRYRLSFPPICEQSAIVSYLDTAVADLDLGIGKAKRQIDLAREYHTRLVADVVTGKLDVRDVALPEPALDDADMLDDLDEAPVDVDATEDQGMYAGQG